MGKARQIALYLIIAAVFFAVCGTAGCAVNSSSSAAAVTVMPETTGVIRLFCTAKTMEEARSIADSYGITLVSYENTVAVFETGKTYSDIAEFGQNHNLPGLEIDQEMKASS